MHASIKIRRVAGIVLISKFLEFLGNFLAFAKIISASDFEEKLHPSL